MTWIDQSTESSALKRPICGEGHVLPARNGLHALGATYELQFDHLDTNERANQVNLQKLDQLAGNINWHRAAKDQWAGIRTAAPDYLPVVGPVPDKPLFQQRFARLVDDSKRWLAVEGAFLPGLYICAGFGSRGLTSVPVCAEWLASVINNEPGFMPRDIVRALSAGRFLIKDIVLGKNGNAGQKMDVTFK